MEQKGSVWGITRGGDSRFHGGCYWRIDGWKGETAVIHSGLYLWRSLAWLLPGTFSAAAASCYHHVWIRLFLVLRYRRRYPLWPFMTSDAIPFPMEYSNLLAAEISPGLSPHPIGGSRHHRPVPILPRCRLQRLKRHRCQKQLTQGISTLMHLIGAMQCIFRPLHPCQVVWVSTPAYISLRDNSLDTPPIPLLGRTNKSSLQPIDLNRLKDPRSP